MFEERRKEYVEERCQKTQNKRGQRKKKKIPKKKDILFKKGTKGKKGAEVIYLFCVNKFGPRMPETLRDALNSISMAMDVHIYTYFVKSS